MGPGSPLGLTTRSWHVRPRPLSTERHRTCEVKRTHANKVNVRLTTGATGHEEGKEIVIRWPNSCTRAPSLSKRH
jgi:hypothetical protein